MAFPRNDQTLQLVFGEKMRVKEKIIGYMKRYLKGREAYDILDASLLDEGIIDSVAVIEIVSFIEDTFGIKVEDEEIIPNNLDSINKIDSYVQRKISANTP
jgi:acyl carrier protein